MEDKIGKWVQSGREARQTAVSASKLKEKEEEERKKAKAKGLSLEDYRKWRDREMWTNDFNALRKKQFKGDILSPEEAKIMADLQKKLEASGGVPPPSKTMLAEKEKQQKK